MQYIKKGEKQPGDWDSWFTTGTGKRSYDYNLDFSGLNDLPKAREFLLKEQFGLCAYCQQRIDTSTSSIEHVIPKEFNLELSTNYFNLVAVCKTSPKDPVDGRVHCDKHKLSKIISPLLFVSNACVELTANHNYFLSQADGSIVPKHSLNLEDKKLAEIFIELSNLNHSNLKQRRAKDHLDKILEVAATIPKPQHRSFWERQFIRIFNDPTAQFRQFLLIFISTKLGR